MADEANLWDGESLPLETRMTAQPGKKALAAVAVVQ